MAPRRPRDIEAELKALHDKARQLRTKQKSQLGELLLATGAADALDPDALAGLLLDGIERSKTDPNTLEGWRRRGDAFFRRERAASAAAGSTARQPRAAATPAASADAPRPAAGEPPRQAAE
ncbi:conjugal transfer protein TraD [Muricoccus roseus]|uniref:conjugal transfer protein TraD n=1 Tax=Muricoccus roseus TaxID=198092 RepID=UPI0009324EEE|nr:conjugal transfer protein TraD [Roseomonas rosea]